MKCPYCDKEMTEGRVVAGRNIIFTNKPRRKFLTSDEVGTERIIISYNNWSTPTCDAFHCATCHKVIIDY